MKKLFNLTPNQVVRDAGKSIQHLVRKPKVIRDREKQIDMKEELKTIEELRELINQNKDK